METLYKQTKKPACTVGWVARLVSQLAFPVEKMGEIPMGQQSSKKRKLFYLFTRLSGLQDAIASVTDQPAAQQLLLVGGHALEDVVAPLTPISSFPVHIKNSTIYLFPRDSATAEPPRLSQPEIRQ